MIIFGWKSRNKTVREGVFYSPAAGRDAPYRLVEARRWFTLFFIPIIPLNLLGTFVECQVTKTAYDPRVLDGPTNAQITDQLEAGVREVVVAVALADGTVTDRQRELALETIGGYVDGYGESDLDGDISRSADAALDARLAYLAGSLNGHGKERLLTAAAVVMAAGDQPDDRERDVVRSIGEQLSMSPAHVRGIIDTAASVTDSPNAH